MPKPLAKPGRTGRACAYISSKHENAVTWVTWPAGRKFRHLLRAVFPIVVHVNSCCYATDDERNTTSYQIEPENRKIRKKGRWHTVQNN